MDFIILFDLDGNWYEQESDATSNHESATDKDGERQQYVDLGTEGWKLLQAARSSSPLCSQPRLVTTRPWSNPTKTPLTPKAGKNSFNPVSVGTSSALNVCNHP